MSQPRRDFFKQLLAAGAMPGVFASSAFGRGIPEWFDQSAARVINPDFDAQAYDFWSGFLSKDAEPVAKPSEPTRGGGSANGNELAPVFFHYGAEGFKNAAELDAAQLITEGDVSVSLNTSTIKIAPQDIATFNKLQNAQIRVDVAQKTSILPMLEAMAYTVVSGMVSLKAELGKNSSGSSSSKSKPSGGKPSSPSSSKSSGKSSGGGGSVQSIAVTSDPAWQKMQNIILPGGEGRWALNLEAQKKDSLFCKILQNVVKESGQFGPMIGLPGIAMTALQSFNNLYGAMHAQPVQVIKSNPLRVFATQEAIQKTGAPGSVTGILLRSGTYVLIPGNQAPSTDDLKTLTVSQGRIVPPKTPNTDLDEAAADTLKGVTYVSFDIEVTPTSLFGSTPGKKSG